MNNNQLEQLLKSYLDGTATEEETAFIEQWFAKHEDAPGITQNLTTEQKQALQEKAFTNILNHIDDANSFEAKQPKGKVVQLTKWLKIAAVAAVLTVAVAGTWLLTTNKNNNNISAHISSVVNNKNYVLKLVLPDSSIVWMNPGATINYPDSFATASRNVVMQGDCFFEVRKNPKRPFIIQSSRLVTKVWGTSFRVFDIPGKSEAKVTVVTGKVSVSKRQQNAGETALQPIIEKNEVILLPKQEVTYNNSENSLVQHAAIDMGIMQKWEPNNLNFDNTELTEIVKQIETAFAVKIIISDDNLRTQKMTASLTGLNLADVLEVLKVSMQLQYSINDNTIRIFK